MVQRKPARKRPKDPGAVVLRGGAAPPPRGDPAGSRGGGAARAPLPGYMRPTSCSDARAAATVVGDAPPPPPRRDDPLRAAKVVFTEAAVPRVGRATCSSTLKGPGGGAGASGAHVCTYGYCSLKGHAHASAVAPLGAFVASRRRLIKTQQSMKLKGASPFRKPNNKGAVAGDGFFVGIRAGAGAAAPTAGSDVSCSASDLPAEEEEVGAMVVGRVGYVMFGHLGCCGGGDYAAERGGRAEHFGASADGSCGSSDVVSDASSVELLLGTTRTKHHRGREEEAALVFHEEDFGACKSDISEELDAKHKRNISGDTVGNTPKESSVDSVSSSALSGISFEDVSSACADAASSRKNKSSISRRRITSEEGVKQMRPFKPKPPNFLPAETGPEAEKVDLRHQTADDRRTAEEWMVDFALRKAVKKLARAQKRKVEMLVQAFETVLPTAGNEKPQPQQDNDTASFTLARPSQACS